LFLDTRTKIVPLHELHERLQDRPASWVSGYFDPLLAEHVRRLSEEREPGRLLVVEITNPAQPLLAQRARAELVAALAMVDYVVLGNGASDASTDAGITERFIEHVLERHRQETR
jgi:bifunctional ADP-heptose synthase (sugar kinase/adenylyltransferase)